MKWVETDIKNYLLGQMETAKREEFEADILLDAELLEEIEISEEELVADYLDSELNAAEKERFEQYFLPLKGNREEIYFAKSLRSCSESGESKIETGIHEKTSFFDNLRAFFQRPAGMLIGAAAIIILGFSLWFVLLNNQNNLEKDIIALNQNTQNTLTGEKLFVIGLMPGTLRDSDPSKPFTPPPSAEMIQLQLAVPETKYLSYKAILQKNGHQTIATIDKLAVYEEDKEKEVRLLLPLKSLENGSYQVLLEGMTKIGKSETIGTYNFKLGVK